jgi:hypothetical protein
VALFLDQSGASNVAFIDLGTIAANLGLLGLAGPGVLGGVPDPTVARVVFNESSVHSKVGDRLDNLVNKIPVPIVITGLPSDGTLPDGSSIAGNGLTFKDQVNGLSIVRVVYDTGQCFNNGIFAIGTDGTTRVPTPGPVVLYHELSHAFRFATGTQKPNEAQEEIAAETDENDMRTKVGVPLRKVDSHVAGCGFLGVPDPGGGELPVPTITTAQAQPATLQHTNQVTIQWRAARTYGFYQVIFSVDGERMPQVTIDSAGQSGSFATPSARAGVRFGFIVQGCVAGLLGFSHCSKFSGETVVVSVPNLRSIRKFLAQSGVDGRAGLRRFFRPNSVLSLRKLLAGP